MIVLFMFIRLDMNLLNILMSNMIIILIIFIIYFLLISL